MSSKTVTMPNKAGIKKAWPFVLLGVCVLLFIAGIITLIVIFASPKSRANKMIAKAEEKLLNESYQLVLTTVADSTNAAIKESLKNTDPLSITVVLDGDSFLLADPIGDGMVTYCYYDGTLYIDESVTNTYTRSEMNAEKLASFREMYITPNIIEYKADGYTKSKITKDKDGNKAVLLYNLTDKKTEEIEAGLKTDNISSITAAMSVDQNETGTIIIFDDEGRYKSIEQVYGIRMDFGDYKALVTLTAKKEYSYGNSAKLSKPEGFVDLSGDYKDIFASSFKVTTNVGVSTNDDELLERLYSVDALFGSVRHNILSIDGNNFKCEYPNTAEPAEGQAEADGISEVWTLIGDTLYLDYKQTNGGETVNEKLKQDSLVGANRTSAFYEHVKVNIFPAFARDFTDMTVSKDQNGVTTVVCRGLSESMYNGLSSVMNAMTGQSGSTLGIVINNDKCTYIVTYDENGRFLSTKVTIDVTPVDITDNYPFDSESIYIERTFDYDDAESYYESVGAAYQKETWIKAPDDASEYRSDMLYYN